MRVNNTVFIITFLFLLFFFTKPVQSQTSVFYYDMYGKVANIEVGLIAYYSESILNGDPGYPDYLDSAQTGNCSNTNRCFEEVLEFPVIQRWSKLGPYRYQYNPLNYQFIYDPDDGSFSKVFASRL